MTALKFATVFAGALALAGCATTPQPVEVTRFVAPSAQDQLAQGTIFVESAPGDQAAGIELSPYKSAVAQQLAALGYREAPRDGASQIAQVSVERSARMSGSGRSPVSVGLGGGTGGYSSGVGMGIGINLGGGPKEVIDTRLHVMIRDRQSGQSVWEGRAEHVSAASSAQADPAGSAATMAKALFTDFPGNNGETISVGVK
ncbi:MAG: DUF4136 domain-containing protein [Sphingomonadaceae bacterium]